MEGGDWLKDRFEWKQALGPAIDRPGHWNGNWGYWSTDGPRSTLSALRLSLADTRGWRPESVKQNKAIASCGCASWLIGSSGAKHAWRGFLQGGQLASRRPALLLELCPAALSNSSSLTSFLSLYACQEHILPTEHGAEF